MKALSCRQPWAWLIVMGWKPLENRGVRTNYRGEVLIHAGLQFDHDGYEWVRDMFPLIPLPEPDQFPLGGIVGAVEIIGCLEGTGALTPRYANWFMPPAEGKRGFSWILATPRTLPFRPLKGMLGLFNVEREEI